MKSYVKTKTMLTTNHFEMVLAMKLAYFNYD